jgi:cell division protein FtsX
MALKGITWAGYLLRYAAAAVLVFASYNPNYSYFHWFRDMLTEGIDPLVIFAGVILLIGWTIFLRATVRSLGAFGLTLAFAFFGTFVWMLIHWNLVSVDSFKTMVYLIEVVLIGVLGTGISWSHIRRRVTGQVDVDEVEGDV